MELKFKKLSEKAVMPIRAYDGDAGIDLTCTSVTTALNECGQLMLVYHTDLAVEIPDGYVGLLFPRSGIYKKSLELTNSVGVIDSGYRGEITAIMHPTTDVLPAIYKEGDRCCQLIIMQLPEYDIVEAEELSETTRGKGGFGSSDENIGTVPTAEPKLDEAENTVDDEMDASYYVNTEASDENYSVQSGTEDMSAPTADEVLPEEKDESINLTEATQEAAEPESGSEQA